MNSDAPDTRDRFKGWTPLQRTFQYTGTFLIICAVGAFALLTAGGGFHE